MTPSETEKAQHALARLGNAVGRHDVERFLEGLPRRYLETHSPEEIASHLRMSRRLNDQPVQVSLRSRGRLFELTVLTPDRPFLFASITGTLAAWGMNILKADAFANAAGVVVDTFRFEDLFRTLELNPWETDRLEQSVADVLTGEVSVQSLMSGRVGSHTLPCPTVKVPTRIVFDDASSPHSVLLELITQDRPGLLYQVSATLARFGCNIEVALTDTEGQKAIDVFYLTHAGRKLDESTKEALRRTLQRQLEGDVALDAMCSAVAT